MSFRQLLRFIPLQSPSQRGFASTATPLGCRQPFRSLRRNLTTSHIEASGFTSRFPEEPFDLPPSQGGGYYPGQLNTKIDDAVLVRKLGFGPRSSVWLVKWEGSDCYSAIKVFTVAASSEAEEKRFTALSTLLQQMPWLDPHPNIMLPFWKESIYGCHLCLPLDVHGGLSIDDLRRQSLSGRLPVHTVQYALSTVAETLNSLHRRHIMHGGVSAENIVFWVWPQEQNIGPLLSAPETSVIDGVVTVMSQPLPVGNPLITDSMRTMMETWMLFLSGYKYAQVGPTYSCESRYHYASAPETLLSNATCSPKTDIWMLGVMLFKLLTGRALLTSTGTTAQKILEMRDVFGDQIPDAWLQNESVLRGSDEFTGKGNICTLEKRLSEALHPDEVPGATDLLQKCLRLDPELRISAEDLLREEWVTSAPLCSCGYPH